MTPKLHWFYLTESGALALVAYPSQIAKTPWPWMGHIFTRCVQWDVGWGEHGEGYFPSFDLAQPLFPASHLFRKLNPPPST